MLKDNRTPARLSWRLATHSLSGRLLLLTILFVMTSVALIYFPSVARYHHELLQERINAAQLAILPFTEAPGEQLSEELRMQLLVRAMQRITSAMTAFRANPEDPERILRPSTRRDEIGTAERELSTMQHELYGFLQQKTRLAALGLAVAKIQHDLRNILSSAQIASDRLTTIEDPVVKRVTPRLVDALDPAIALATNTLRFGKAEERAPQRTVFALSALVDEAAASALPEGGGVNFDNRVPSPFQIDADSEQLFRVLLNLLSNAREALESPDQKEKHIVVDARRKDGAVTIEIADTGPGIPPAVRERLFQPFAGTARAGGSRLGL